LKLELRVSCTVHPAFCALVYFSDRVFHFLRPQSYYLCLLLSWDYRCIPPSQAPGLVYLLKFICICTHIFLHLCTCTHTHTHTHTLLNRAKNSSGVLLLTSNPLGSASDCSSPSSHPLRSHGHLLIKVPGQFPLHAALVLCTVPSGIFKWAASITLGEAASWSSPWARHPG
jgi:hypothetical protein